jgi:hypothetical protein
MGSSSTTPIRTGFGLEVDMPMAPIGIASGVKCPLPHNAGLPLLCGRFAIHIGSKNKIRKRIAVSRAILLRTDPDGCCFACPQRLRLIP